MSNLLFFLSPAKKMNVSPFQLKGDTSNALYDQESKEIMKEIQGLSKEKLEKVMAAKSKLLDEVIDVHESWSKGKITWPAASIYNGDAYTRLSARVWSADTWNFAQNHLVILSGLYGWLRPKDLIKPYRLMVGAPLKLKNGQSLYQFWQDKVIDQLEEYSNCVGVMTASKEYAQMITFPNPIQKWIFVDFKVQKGKEYVSVSSFSKQARGEMVRLAMQGQINNVNDLKKMDVLGFSFNNNLSDDQNWIYVKPNT